MEGVPGRPTHTRPRPAPVRPEPALPTARDRPRGRPLVNRVSARRPGKRPQSCRWDLNPGPRPYQGRALPTEPRQHGVPCVVSPRSLVPSLACSSGGVACPASGRLVLPCGRSCRPLVIAGLVSLPHVTPVRPARFTPSSRAGDGNRTHVACLEGRYSTIELHPPGSLVSPAGPGLRVPFLRGVGPWDRDSGGGRRVVRFVGRRVASVARGRFP
jgi:hypothetical protein